VIQLSDGLLKRILVTGSLNTDTPVYSELSQRGFQSIEEAIPSLVISHSSRQWQREQGASRPAGSHTTPTHHRRSHKHKPHHGSVPSVRLCLSAASSTREAQHSRPKARTFARASYLTLVDGSKLLVRHQAASVDRCESLACPLTTATY
jgi:hypothetical protein